MELAPVALSRHSFKAEKCSEVLPRGGCNRRLPLCWSAHEIQNWDGRRGRLCHRRYTGDIHDASKMASLPSYQSRFCSGSFLALEFTLIPSICHLILEAHQFTLIKVCSNAQALTIRQQPAHQRAYGLFLISAYILHTHLLRNMVVVPGCRDTFYPRFGRGTRHEALELKGTANTSSSPTPSRSRHLGCVGPPRIGHLPVASRNSLIR
ncbi:hypothetical protein V8E52_011924 [Russula decolorans]